MKLYQLANDVETYGKRAGWWLVVSDDLEDELSEPQPTKALAQYELGILQQKVQLGLDWFELKENLRYILNQLEFALAHNENANVLEYLMQIKLCATAQLKKVQS